MDVSRGIQGEADMSEEYGFKELTVENWREADPTTQVFGNATGDEARVLKVGDDWARRILAIKLPERVPFDIRSLFEVAKGTMLYGYFFYPIFTLASQQLHRITEAAVNDTYKRLGGPVSKGTSMNKKLDFLQGRGLIRVEGRTVWNLIWIVRNLGSHPNRQDITMPTTAVSSLTLIANMIQSLYPEEEGK